VVEVEFLQFFNAPLLEQLEMIPHGVLAHTSEFGDLLVGQIMALEPQGFHAALDDRMGMVIPPIVQVLSYFGGEFKLDGHSFNYTTPSECPAEKRNLCPCAV
jgi:hypothetical protein